METAIGKYLFEVSYTAQGAKGLLEGGGGKRRAAAELAAKSVGGNIESFYFAFGDADAFVIADVPDHASASAISLAVSASGGAHCKTIVLMTPEEVDQASKKPLTYTGPLVSIGGTSIHRMPRFASHDDCCDDCRRADGLFTR
jgi:uncharacterized protein with GYD domain